MLIQVNLAKKEKPNTLKPTKHISKVSAAEAAKEYSKKLAVNKKLSKPLMKKKTQCRVENKENLSIQTLETENSISSFNNSKLSFKDSDSFHEFPHLSLIEKFLKIDLDDRSVRDKNLFLNRKHRQEINHSDAKRLSTSFTRATYEDSIYEEYFERNLARANFLDRHEVTERMRMRMADWQVEVMHNYKCNDQTYFISMTILDRYFKETTETIIPNKLHGLGIAAMFLASKYNEISPLRLSVIYEKIAHRKISCDELKMLEKEISDTLNYEFVETTSLDFGNIYFESLFSAKDTNFLMQNTKLTTVYEFKANDVIKINANSLDLIKLVLVYLLKMNVHDYKLSQLRPSILAAASLYVALKISEQIEKKVFVNERLVAKLVELCRHKEDEVIKIAQKILYNAQNFDKVFKGLENLKRIHFNAILEARA